MGTVDDRTFLIWVYERLMMLEEDVRSGLADKPNELADYYHQLRAIIYNTPAGRKSEQPTCNSIAELKEKLVEDFRRTLNP